jgi:hypothetical protein
VEARKFEGREKSKEGSFYVQDFGWPVKRKMKVFTAVYTN